jgi:hypothetical protein
MGGQRSEGTKGEIRKYRRGGQRVQNGKLENIEGVIRR